MALRRIFVAIDLSEDVRQGIAEHVLGLKAAFPEAPVKWESPEKFHTTMKFFGDADERQLEEITNLVSQAVESVSQFQLTVRKPGSFLRPENAVLWIGVEESPGEAARLKRIAGLLEGENRQPRRFHPHITIARIKRPRDARDLIYVHNSSVLEARKFVVDRLTIYESKLLTAGSVYSVVARRAVGGRQ
jgi:2'-5' RNA ligase